MDNKTVNVKMTGDLMLVEPLPVESKIELLGNVADLIEAKVIACGPGFPDRPSQVQVGDVVVFLKGKYPKYKGYDVIRESSTLLIDLDKSSRKNS